MATLVRESPVRIADPSDELRSLVAREGTQLAEVLRSLGWQARAGWRQVVDDGGPIWFVRFERPARGARL